MVEEGSGERSRLVALRWTRHLKKPWDSIARRADGPGPLGA